MRTDINQPTFLLAFLQCHTSMLNSSSQDRKRKAMTAKATLKGTLFFLHLSNQLPIVIKNIERILGAQISQFLHNGVTVNSDANVDSISTFKA